MNPMRREILEDWPSVEALAPEWNALLERSRANTVRVPVEITDTIMPGVVSLPHGWGHDAPGTRLHVAATHAGANSNLLADEQAIDAVSGNAVLNGIEVQCLMLNVEC